MYLNTFFICFTVFITRLRFYCGVTFVGFVHLGNFFLDKSITQPFEPDIPTFKSSPTRDSQPKIFKKNHFLFFSFWDYESPAALKPTSKSV